MTFIGGELPLASFPPQDQALSLSTSLDAKDVSRMNKASIRSWQLAAVFCMALACGCTKSEPPAFQLNMLDLEQQEVPRDQQQTIANVLEAMYGTPNDPYVLPETGLKIDRIEMAAGPVWSDEHGRQRGLYRQHCGHCHGTSGDGAGPTAMILDPYPRDYRPGLFKFKSTERGAKPTDEDLKRVVHDGVPGTAMPSFALLPEAEIDALVEYVKYLSLRGETERGLVSAVLDLGEGEKLPIERATLVDEVLQPIVERWTTANESVIRPAEKPAIELAQSVDKGRELFYGTRANCVKCHGPSALGDGQTTDYDDWSKPIAELARTVAATPEQIAKDKEMSKDDKDKALARNEELAEALEGVLPPRPIRPRNLRLGVYRGGRRPLDLYRRFHAGIAGAPMPGVGPSAPGGQGTLSPDEIWQLVDYVMSLPYEPTSAPPRQPKFAGQTPR